MDSSNIPHEDGCRSLERETSQYHGPCDCIATPLSAHFAALEGQLERIEYMRVHTPEQFWNATLIEILSSEGSEP